MNVALRLMLIGLALVVVLFAVTWTSIPSGATDEVAPPASLFIRGLGDKTFGCLSYGTSFNSGQRVCTARGDVLVGRALTDDDVDALKTRVFVLYGSIAAVIVLLGLAFGAGRRKSKPPSPPSPPSDADEAT